MDRETRPRDERPISKLALAMFVGAILVHMALFGMVDWLTGW